MKTKNTMINYKTKTNIIILGKGNMKEIKRTSNLTRF